MGQPRPGRQEFHCPTCRRHLQLSEDKFGLAVDGLRAATRRNPVVLDVSALPF